MDSGLVQEKLPLPQTSDYQRIRKRKLQGARSPLTNLTNIILPGTLAVFRPL